MSNGSCSHLSAITTIKLPDRRECAECVKIGAQWVHLRTCQQCGVTLCCDSSPNQHASKHARGEALHRPLTLEVLSFGETANP